MRKITKKTIIECMKTSEVVTFDGIHSKEWMHDIKSRIIIFVRGLEFEGYTKKAIIEMAYKKFN